jgi:hypothetical protein
MKKLEKIRDRLEKELDIYLPINIMLKGRQVRIGNLREPEIILIVIHFIIIFKERNHCQDNVRHESSRGLKHH